MKKKRTASLIVILAAGAALALFAGISFGGIKEDRKAVSPSLAEQREFKREIAALHGKHNAELLALYREFKEKLPSAGRQEFRLAESRIGAAVSHFSSFSETACLVGLTVCDKLRGGNRTQERLAQYLGPNIIAPCTAGSQAIQECFENYLHQLREKNNLFRAELAQKLKNFSPQKRGEAEREGFIRDLASAEGKIRETASAKQLLTAGAAVEALLYKQILRALAAIGRKAIAKTAAGTAAAAADGPLPAGDIIAVIGVVWCAYDICQVQLVLPEELRSLLTQAVTGYEQGSRAAALNAAEQMTESCITSARSAVTASF